MRQKLRDNGLSLAMFGLFLFAFTGQILTGARDYNEQQKAHHQAEASLPVYLTSGHFIEATFENWESEFLQMGVYVLLTVALFQRGSSESKDPDDPEDESAEEIEKARGNPDAPGPVRKGGLALTLYANSLSIALLSLFAVSFALHVYGGWRAYNQEQMAHGEASVTIGAFLGSAHFWFQSFQNWQSEFLSIGMLVVLSIFLRQRNSPESKKVSALHSETGGD